MPEGEEVNVVIFIASLYGFAIVLLYVLAKAWEQALSQNSHCSGRSPGSSGTSPSVRR